MYVRALGFPIGLLHVMFLILVFYCASTHVEPTSAAHRDKKPRPLKTWYPIKIYPIYIRDLYMFTPD